MKNLNMAVKVLVAAGILLALYSIAGRFLGGRAVLGWLIPGGMAASSAMIGANTLLLLAVLAKLCGKD
ncbi:hypothetical protein ACFLS1_00750 [Verrucomicrobiota bacterium]